MSHDKIINGYIKIQCNVVSLLCSLPLAVQFFPILGPNTYRYSLIHWTTPMEDNARRQCPPKPWLSHRVLYCIQPLHAGAQYRTPIFCECGGDLNTNYFSSVRITLSNQDSGNVNQNSHADFLASLLAGERTWTLCGLKAFHFKFFLRTFHTVLILRSNLSEASRMWFLSFFVKKFFTLSTASTERGLFTVACRGWAEPWSFNLFMLHFPGILRVEHILKASSNFRWTFSFSKLPIVTEVTIVFVIKSNVIT